MPCVGVWRIGRWDGGHLYQGRFKAFPVESGSHVLTVCRYVERNALSAGVVRRAEDWRWGSLWLRHQATMDNHTRALGRMMSAGPMGRWPDLKPWTESVNTAQTKREWSRLEVSEERSQPFGGVSWMGQTAVELGLEHTIRPEGRPAKANNRDLE